MYARTMTWLDSATVYSLLPSTILSLNGSLKFYQGVHWNLYHNFINAYSDRPLNEISYSGAEVHGDLRFTGLGEWHLLSPINSNFSNQYYFTANNLKTNSHPVSYHGFYCSNSNLMASQVDCSVFDGTNIDGDSSSINAYIFITHLTGDYFTVNSVQVNSFDSCQFKNLTCVSLGAFNNDIENFILLSGSFPGINNGISGSDNMFRKAELEAEDFFIDGVQLFDTIYFTTPAQEVDIRDIVHVIYKFGVNSNASFPTRIVSTNMGTISKSSDTICIDNVYLQNINAIGGATYYAGSNSFDLGGNTGWLFLACPFTNEVSEIAENNWILFPNPARERVIFENNKNEVSSYALYDINGQKLFEKPVNGKHFIIERNNLPGGIYLLKIIYNNSSTCNYEKVVFY